jgi:hypothetical protein
MIMTGGQDVTPLANGQVDWGSSPSWPFTLGETFFFPSFIADFTS